MDYIPLIVIIQLIIMIILPSLLILPISNYSLQNLPFL